MRRPPTPRRRRSRGPRGRGRWPATSSNPVDSSAASRSTGARACPTQGCLARAGPATVGSRGGAGSVAGPGEVGVADRAELVAALLADLRAEGDELDAVVAQLEDTAWLTPTPAEGWTVAHQIAHLAWTDDQALLAATDPDGFGRLVAEARPGARRRRRRGGRGGRRGRRPSACSGAGGPAAPALAEELAALPDGARIPWFGPPMSAASMATARLMETWAHGLDVTDALRVVAVGLAAGCGTSPTSASAPATSPSASTACPPPAEEFRVELDRAGRRHVGVGPGGRGAAGHRPRARLLPAGHPAPAPRRPGADRRSGRTPTGGWTSPRPSPGRRERAAPRRRRRDGNSVTARCGSATPRASTATGGRRCARCSRAARSTSSPATTSPS